MKKYKLPLLKEDIDKLITKYFVADEHTWPDWMSYSNSQNEVRYDYDSSKICYSLIRDFKPTNCLEFGTSFGHSTILITDALLKNGTPFDFMGFEMVEGLYDKTVANLTKRHKKVIPTIIKGDITKYLEEIPDNLDFVFIDSNHEEGSTQFYVDCIFPKIVSGGLVAIHDFAVTDVGGEWQGKGTDGAPGLPETGILMDLQKKGELPLEKLYWTYPDSARWGGSWEGSWWIKK